MVDQGETRRPVRFGKHALMNVVHCKKNRYDIYIGRPSEWGNPFEIGIHGTRSQVIAKYEEYLLSNEELMAKIPELRGKVLGCWCSPKPCHGDVLARLANASSLSSFL